MKKIDLTELKIMILNESDSEKGLFTPREINLDSNEHRSLEELIKSYGYRLGLNAALKCLDLFEGEMK